MHVQPGSLPELHCVAGACSPPGGLRASQTPLGQHAARPLFPPDPPPPIPVSGHSTLPAAPTYSSLVHPSPSLPATLIISNCKLYPASDCSLLTSTHAWSRLRCPTTGHRMGHWMTAGASRGSPASALACFLRACSPHNCGGIILESRSKPLTSLLKPGSHLTHSKTKVPHGRPESV